MQILAWPIKTPWNPYTGLVYSNLRADVKSDGWPGNLLRKYAVWHVHWPDALLNIPNSVHAACKLTGMFATMDYLRLRGTRVVWTMHNVASHEKLHPWLEAWFWRHFIPRVDGVISLSLAGLEMATERFPRLREIPTTVIPHGHYRDQYPKTTTDSRKLLGIPQDSKVLMFFGAIRAYKNVNVLIRAFRETNCKKFILYIVGSPNSAALADQIRKEAGFDNRVILKFEFVDTKDVSRYFSAADLVVLPYREVLNSGSTLLALSFNRPVLVPDRGAMGELKQDFGDSWVRTFSGDFDRAILERAVDWAGEARPQVCPMPEKYEWRSIGRETARFYGRVIAKEQ